VDDFEYGIRYADGEIMGWSCGCPRIYSTAVLAQIDCNATNEFSDERGPASVVKRVTPQWLT
jgi:hypothetical protein